MSAADSGSGMCPQAESSNTDGMGSSKVERCGSNARSSLSSSMAAAGSASCGAGELAVAELASDATDACAAAAIFEADGAGLGNSLRLKSRLNRRWSLSADEAAIMSRADEIGGAIDGVDSTGNFVLHLEQFLAA